MVKKPKIKVCLEIKTNDGEILHLSDPLTIFDKSQSPFELRRGFGEGYSLATLSKESVYAIQGYVESKKDVFVVCKPFAWLRWVEITEGSDKPTPVTALDKFKTEE